jgi:hypothetical protein
MKMNCTPGMLIVSVKRMRYLGGLKVARTILTRRLPGIGFTEFVRGSAAAGVLVKGRGTFEKDSEGFRHPDQNWKCRSRHQRQENVRILGMPVKASIGNFRILEMPVKASIGNFRILGMPVKQFWIKLTF